MLKRLIIFSSLCLFGCAVRPPIISPEVRTQHANSLAQAAGWKEKTIYTSAFILKSYGPRPNYHTKTLTIYIEGDGLAWLAKDLPSNNPTPVVPTGLEMAIHDQKNKSVVYLARPCQFVFNQAWVGCQSTEWTNLRFAPIVIDSMNQAVSELKKDYHAKQIILVGYSGGGAIAALIAARRTDVIKLITVAAILDTQEWVKQENLTPLYGSLNPADAWKPLVAIPQTHWVGGKDRIVPKEVAFAFANHFPANKKPKIMIVPAFNHTCCWATAWTPS